MAQTLPDINDLIIRKKETPPSFIDLVRSQPKEVPSSVMIDGTVVTPERSDLDFLRESKAEIIEARKALSRKKKISQRKAKQAQHLEAFKLSHGFSSVYYRYLRTADTENKIHPRSPGHGEGACFLIIRSSIDKFVFSVSRCSGKDKFNKDVARYVCQQNYSKGKVYTVHLRGSVESFLEHIRLAIINCLYMKNKKEDFSVLTVPMFLGTMQKVHNHTLEKILNLFERHKKEME
jgi:hypothetical protein